MHPLPDPAAALATELRRREVILAAVIDQVERVMRLVGDTANDPHWRGPAAQAYAGAVGLRLQGLTAARRSLDVAGGALAWARHEAEERAIVAAAARAAGAGAHG